MLKLKGFSTRLALCCTGWQLRLLLRYSKNSHKIYLYQSANLFRKISRLTRRRDLLEQKLTLLQKGGITK